MSEIAALRARFAEFGQDHVFRWWPELDADGRSRLVDQAARIDLEALARIHAAQLAAVDSPGSHLAPVAVEGLSQTGRDLEATAAAHRRGEEMLAAGRVAALVVAGGQGSRLGFAGPKGAYAIGPVSDRTLFEIQAQKLLRLRQRYACALPWCVMTSASTDAATRDFFRSHHFFGLPEADVLFFSQGVIPSLDFSGRLLLAARDRIFENPDGHGGCLTGLLASGVLDTLEARGIDTLFYYQVDNPLVRMCDPLYLGLHDRAGAEISCKVVRKSDPDEKVGIVARVGERVSVVEYTELDDADRRARDARGDLVYWTGNIAIHLFATACIRRVALEADRWLPFHASAKQIPHLDDSGLPVRPEQPNGRKFERFVFDALAAANRVCVVEAERSIEFSPVKNAEGADSPDTARRDLTATYRRWLAEAEVPLPAGAVVEIDHSRIDATEDVRRLGIRTIADAGDAVRVASGEPV
jgi:UDP-N-acetylglucosamine/UDP-N-acetylgalactosamine diphosphorylase